MYSFFLIVIFVASTLVGYKVISQVPSLLHTPLMSGMNALSGVTILGAVTAFAVAKYTGSELLGSLAIILAMVNVVGGFFVTHRMLSMFDRKKS